MHNNGFDDQILKAAIVAKLLVEGKKPREICEIMTRVFGGQAHYGEPRVAELKSKAVENGLLMTVLPENTWTPAMCAAVDRLLCGGDLVSALSRLGVGRVRSVRVVTSGHRNEASDWGKRLQLFGKHAAPFMRDAISRGTNIAFAWGSTIRSPLDAMRNLEMRDFTAKINKRFIPTRGEPRHVQMYSASSSLLARLASHIVFNDETHATTLYGVGAIVPIHWEKEKSQAIWEYFSMCTEYTRTFGNERNCADPSLGINQVDTIITSVSTKGYPLHMFEDELVDVGGVDRPRFQRLVDGDIGGVLLPAPNLSAQDRAWLDRISQCVPGATLEHYQKVAKKSADSQGAHPGVVAFAIGENKADPLLAAIQCDLINELIIDYELALAIWKKIDPVHSDAKMRWLRTLQDLS